MKKSRSGEEFDRRLHPGDPLHDARQLFARLHIETEKVLRGARADLDALFRSHREEIEQLLRPGTPRDPDAPPGPRPPKRPRRPRGKGGSEPVTVEPNRPRRGEGGAAAEMEFDD